MANLPTLEQRLDAREAPEWIDELDLDLLLLNAWRGPNPLARPPMQFTYHRPGRPTLVYLRWEEDDLVRYWREDVLIERLERE